MGSGKGGALFAYPRQPLGSLRSAMLSLFLLLFFPPTAEPGPRLVNLMVLTTLVIDHTYSDILLELQSSYNPTSHKVITIRTLKRRQQLTTNL